MKKTLIFKLVILNLAITALFALPAKCIFAADIKDIFDFSYRLVEGGDGDNRLVLDSRGYLYKGVEVTVTKKDAGVSQLFELRQEMVIDMPAGLKNNFVVHRITESFPASAYFDVQSSDIPVTSRRIYQSDAAGTGLIFKLVYGIINIEDIAPGEYNCQINFILRPISGTATGQITKTLYVRAIINPEGGLQTQIEIAPLTSLHTVYLNSRKEESQAADVAVNINGKFNRVFSIKQVLLFPLESKEGLKLDYEAISLQTKETRIGMGTALKELSGQPLTVYTSGPSGEADKQFLLTYSLGDLSRQRAGRYTAVIQFYLDETGREQRPLEKLGLDVEIEPVFDLLISPQDQRSIIAFADLKPFEPPRKNEVIIEIKTNLGKPYQVSQKVYSELTDKEGNIIAQERFTLKTESLGTKGALKFQDKEVIKKADTVLFISDNKGSPDKFKLIYELTPSLDIKAGDYSTKISYTLSEI